MAMVNFADRASVLQKTTSLRQRQLRNDLRQLMTRSNWDSEFHLVYQPQIDVLTGRPVSVEALLRWHSRHQNVVMPGEFVPIAEQAGLLDQMSRWVMQRVCQEVGSMNQHWHHHPDSLQSLDVSVNISPRQLLELSFLDQIKALIEEKQVTPSNIILELTSTNLLFEHESSTTILQALRDHGFKTSVTLTQQNHQQIAQTLVLIETLPIDILKFDRGFMAVLEQDLEAEAAFFSLVSLAKSWQIHLSAEGIENPDQIEFLSWHGFRILQGYWYSTPISARELQAWLFAHHRWAAC